MSSFPTTQPHDADASTSIAPPTDPRLALLGESSPTPVADAANGEVVRADRWLGDEAPTAPDDLVPTTAEAWVESEHGDTRELPIPTADSLIDGAVMPRRRWELGDDAPDEVGYGTDGVGEPAPTPWPGADVGTDIAVPTLQNDGFGVSDPETSSDLSFGGVGVDDAPFDFSMITDDSVTTDEHADHDLAAESDEDGSSKRSFLAAIDSAATALSNSLPGRRKRNQDDETAAPAGDVEDPLFAEALAGSDVGTDADDTFDFSAPFGTETPAPHHDVTEVTLSEYVDQHMVGEPEPAHTGPSALDDLPSPFGDEAPIFGQSAGDDFFEAPEPSPEDPVMALMADESEVELGRSPKHKLLLTGAGVAGVALLGIGAVAMLNRSGFDTPFGGGDEAPVTLALDETPQISLTEQLSGGLVGISAPTCSTATGGGGVLVSPTTVVTSSSVTGTAPTVEIVLADGDTRVGTLIGVDRASELAVINLDRPAGDALEWGATNAIAVGDTLAVSGVEGDASIVETTLGGTTRLAAQTTELTLAAELTVAPGGAVVNAQNQVLAVALPRSGGVALLTSDVLRPLVSEFRLDPERFDGC